MCNASTTLKKNTAIINFLIILQETVPTWKDKYDIIACLRQSNYDPDDVISTYFTIGDTGVMDSPDRLAGVNKKMIKEKDEKIASLQDKFLKLVSFKFGLALKNYAGNTDKMFENQIMKHKHSPHTEIKKQKTKQTKLDGFSLVAHGSPVCTSTFAALFHLRALHYNNPSLKVAEKKVLCCIVRLRWLER